MLRAVIAVAACAQVISRYPFYDVQPGRTRWPSTCTAARWPAACRVRLARRRRLQQCGQVQSIFRDSTFASAQSKCVAVRRQPVPSREGAGSK